MKLMRKKRVPAFTQFACSIISSLPPSPTPPNLKLCFVFLLITCFIVFSVTSMASPLNYFFKIYTFTSLIFIYLLLIPFSLIPFSNCWIVQSCALLGDQLIPQMSDVPSFVIVILKFILVHGDFMLLLSVFCRCMELSNALVGDHNLLLASLQGSMSWMLILSTCWRLLHLLISIIDIGSHFIQVLACHITSSGFWGRHQVLNLERLQCLAIVVDSEEAKNTTILKQLLQWLSEIGVNHFILYDMEDRMIHRGRITLELLSFSDSKEGTARAASILCSEYLKSQSEGIGKMGMNFTETAFAHVLKKAGCGGPNPDLLLIFGPARCHIGFPAWRISYTELVHMGSLKSLTYGAIVKAIHDYSKTHQNYGA